MIQARPLIFSSLAKKSVMAASGAMLLFFLAAHLFGNSMTFLGRDAFNAYAEALHRHNILLLCLEISLLIAFALHIIFGTLLYLENLRARPVRYQAASSGTARTLAGRTMPYTGLVTLIFVVIHLAQFHFPAQDTLPADLVRRSLGQPLNAWFYIFAVTCVSLHVSHGAWSLLQTLGLMQERHEPVFRRAARLVAYAGGALFVLVPLLTLFADGFLR